MLYRLENAPRRVDPMADIDSAAEPLLKPNFLLRYDRSHAEAAAQDVDHQLAEELSATGETVMDVTGPGSVGGSNPIDPTEQCPTNKAGASTPGLEMPQDETQVSDAEDMLERLSDDSSIRAERLAQIQAEIAAGTYETAEKMELAVERLLRDVR